MSKFPIYERIRETCPEIALELFEQQLEWTVLKEVKRIILNAGIDVGIYEMMKRDIIAGNFDVIYLDDRVVGDDPKRLKAKKELNRIRTACNQRKACGQPIADILVL